MRVRGIAPDVFLKLALRRECIDWDEPRHVFLCVADHYEPMVGGAPPAMQRDRVQRWLTDYPKLFADVEDSWGRPPQHTFFYPAEEYTPEPIEQLANLCREGFGDVEVHLHHDNDTAESLTETLSTFTDHLHRDHGLLRRGLDGGIRYGFIHGNWALDNSRPDGRWCGVNNELQVLIDTGCYADFTLPSAPNPTQTRIVNSIYYARGEEGKAKSHDSGQLASVNAAPCENALLMIQGPLAVDWSRRKWGLLPRIDNAELHGGFPPTTSRLQHWLSAAVQIQGQGNWCFIKLHTHGALDRNADMLLGERYRSFHQELTALRAQHRDLNVYYVTAWEMAELVRQAEDGAVVPRLPAST